MSVLIKIIQLVLALSVLVLVHEFGHFLFSKLFGARVEKFYLFFDAKGIRLFSTRNNKFIRKHFPRLANATTDYGIGWIPLGGYCKISGMVDESMDTGQLQSEPKPWEFRTKKAWQRLLILFGGVLFNFILAILLYISILAIWGSSYITNEDSRIWVNELAYDMGFRNGDHIISFDDYVPENFLTLQADLVRTEAGKARVLRGNDTIDIYLDRSRISEVLDTPGMFDLAVPFVLDTVPGESVNASAGLMRGDRIVAFDELHVDFVQESRDYLASLAGGSVRASVVRGSDTLAVSLQVDTLGRIGVYSQLPGIRSKEYGFLEAVPAGFKLTFDTIGGYLKDLKLVFTPSTGAYKSVGSFIAIGQIFPSAWDWYQFVNILALLSIMLAVMNLIPIPGLDGGHILFTLYEMLTGRKPSDRFLMTAQIIGMVLLLMLMMLAFGNDIGRLIK